MIGYFTELDYREVAEDTRMEEYVAPQAEGDGVAADGKTLSPIQEHNAEQPRNGMYRSRYLTVSV